MRMMRAVEFLDGYLGALRGRDIGAAIHVVPRDRDLIVRQAIAQIDHAPAVRQALEIMVFCYEKMELKELADQTRVMYRANFEGEVGEGRKAPVEKRKWYKLWLST
jgi:hypothetical protein